MAPKKKLLILDDDGPEAITTDELTRMIEAGKERPDAALDVLITPLVARYILEHYNKPSETNRPVSRSAVITLAASLRDGMWENTGEPIIFSDEGWLNDGQHRLLAIIDASIAAPVDIRFGIARHAFGATNTGSRRQPGDALALHGVTNARVVATVARMILAYQTGLPGGMRIKIPNPRIVAALERWPDIPDAVARTHALPQKIKSGPTQALAWFAQRTAPAERVDQFFHVLQTGEGAASHPAHRLREKMLLWEGGQDSSVRIRFMALSILAWNAFRRQEQLSRLDWKQTEKFPRVEGLDL